MPRNYRLKNAGLPDDIYDQVWAIIRGYDRMKLEYDNMIGGSPAPADGQPRGTNHPDTTSHEAVKRADLSKKLEAIEQSYLMLPPRYAQTIWDNIVYRVPYPQEVHRSTYARYKALFFRNIARRMGWI